MKKKKILITGSAGLIGFESVKFFAKKRFEIYGVDNNMRQYFFGDEASTEWSRRKLQKDYKNQYRHFKIDIRDFDALKKLFKN